MASYVRGIQLHEQIKQYLIFPVFVSLLKCAIILKYIHIGKKLPVHSIYCFRLFAFDIQRFILLPVGYFSIHVFL